MSHKINITEALCGFKLVIKHLDGRALVLTHPAGEILGNYRMHIAINSYLY